MREIIKYTKKRIKKKFFDKNGNLIKLGDRLKIPSKIKFIYKDDIIEEEEGKLGLRFICNNIFIPLHVMLDDFFKKCEIIKKNEDI